jgi:DNA primase small subunit
VTNGNPGLCEHCEHCKSSSINYTSLPCNKCINALKKEVKRLTELLTDDLGVNEKSISLYFSGNNGFMLLHLTSPFVLLPLKLGQIL